MDFDQVHGAGADACDDCDCAEDSTGVGQGPRAIGGRGGGGGGAERGGEACYDSRVHRLRVRQIDNASVT